MGVHLPRSIVTDHYLLDHYAGTLTSVYVTNERVGWIWDQSLLTVEINTITRWAVKGSPNVD